MMPIGTKWQKIKQKLQENGLLYQQTLKPAQLLVHPKNRGGAMLSHHDCHQKGAKILAIGADLQKIQSSVAIEVSNLKQTKKDQMEANEAMVKQAEGTLCPPNGQERYLSLGSSHMSQFCKAVLHGCTTANEELAAMSSTGCLNLQACCGPQGAQSPFHTMCIDGWPWDIIVAQVEET